MRIWLAFCLIYGLLAAIFLPQSLLAAEFECVSEVKYSWEYTPPSPPMTDDMKQPPPPLEKEKYEVPFVSRRLRGATEELAKQKFQSVLDQDRLQAMTECKKNHENLSGCVSAKFLSMGSVLRQLDFNARKELESSIVEDCKLSTGRCLKAEASEITCKEVVEPVAETSEEEEEDDKKKKKK